MNNNDVALSQEDIPTVLDDIEQAFFDIPFENSLYQNRKFVIAAQKTPARAYRTIGLRLFGKIQDIQSTLENIELAKIDVEENEYRMSLDSVSDFEKRRLAVKNAAIRAGLRWNKKLLNDALVDIGYMYSELKKFPRYTREEFESEEALHFQLDLEQQASVPHAAVDSLTNMGLNDKRLQEMLENPEEIQKMNAMLDSGVHLNLAEIFGVKEPAPCLKR
jgi:hypothetical protein